MQAKQPIPYSAAVTVASLVAAALLLYRLGEYSLWIDEIMTAHFTGGGFREMIGNVANDVHGPAFYSLLWLTRQIADFSEFALRLPAALAAVATIPIVFLIAKECHEPRAGLWACILLTLNPFFMEFGREARPYSLSALLTAVSWLFFIRILHGHRGKAWILYGAGSGLLLLTFYFGALVVLPQILYGLMARLARKKRMQLVSGWILAGLIFLPWLPVFVFQFLRNDVGIQRYFPFGIGWADVFRSIREPLWGAHSPISSNIATLLTVALIAAAGWMIWKRPQRRRKLGFFAGLALAVSFTAFVLICTIKPLMISRYLTMLAPLLALFLGASLARIDQKAALAIFIAYLLPSLWAYGNYLDSMPRQDWRGAALILKQKAEPDDYIVARRLTGASMLKFYLIQLDAENITENMFSWQTFGEATDFQYESQGRLLWFIEQPGPADDKMVNLLKMKNGEAQRFDLRQDFFLHRFSGDR